MLAEIAKFAMPKRKAIIEVLSEEENSDNEYETDSEASELRDLDAEISESEEESEENEKSEKSKVYLEELGEEFLYPPRSYERVYNEYNNSQKKLEENYEYSWLPGEKKYVDKLSNENLLSDANKNKILSLSYAELFELFVDSKLKKLIIESTIESGYELTLHDLNTVIGFVIFTSFNKRLSQKDYWSYDPFLRAECVAQAIPRNKFLEIKSALKYAPLKDQNDKDKIWRVRRMVEIFNDNILQFGIFTTALSIDEMMVKFYGRLAIKQFIKAKPIRFGIKQWGICSANGYLFYFEIYCGKNSEPEPKLSKIAQGSRVVIQMLEKLLRNTSANKIGQYHVYFDNLFCCPDLLIHLKKLGLRATGVVRNDRIQVQNDIDKKAPRGTYGVQHDKSSGMNFISVQDSKKVSIISTGAGVTPLSTVKRYVKGEGKKCLEFPNAFYVYNQFMGGVDVHDGHCNNLLPTIRSKKWTWVIFMRIIQAAITNATVLYNMVLNQKRNIGSREFAIAIAKEYLRPRSNKTHDIINHTKQGLCSNGKCSVRGRRFCEACNMYLCKKCALKQHA